MDFSLQFDKKKFDLVFPFGFVLDRQMNILHVGKSLEKIRPNLTGKDMSEAFSIKRPRLAGSSFDTILDFSGQIFILDALFSSQGLQFRGQMLPFENDTVIFIGSPWLSDADDFKKHQLSLTDYALHDSITDLLQIVKVKDIANADFQLLNKQLEASEVRYRELVELGSDIIYKLDGAGNICFLNDVAARKLEYSKLEALGKHYSHFVFPKWMGDVDKAFANLVEKEESETYFEFPLKTGSGNELWVGQHTQFGLDEKGGIEIRAFAKDITERKEIEQNLESTELRLAQLIATLHAGILVEDETRHIVLTNSYFCKLFHIPAPPDQLKGADCSNAAEESKVLFEDPETFVKRIDQILKDKKPALGDELHMKNGKILERDYTPIFSGERYLGHLWQYRDVTEKISVQKKLVEARKEAESAQEAEKQFLAHMSHEIRTPLNAIIGMLHLLLDTDLTQEQKEYLNIQKSSTEILTGLVHDILDISKIESGKLDVTQSRIDLNAILENVSRTFQLQLREKPVRMEWEPLQDWDEYVMGDEVLLNQILFNLVGNAIKFTEKGFIAIRARLLERKDKQYMIRFEVEDTGIGISAEKLKQIFERFKQADSQVSIRYGGTGLGLAITKRLVELLGGSIEVESTPKKGSVFSFVLGFPATGERLRQTTSELAASETPDPQVQGRRFLVAEDNVMNTYYIKRIFSKLDVEVDYTANGMEALNKTRGKHYDLIFMDIRMPEMDGLTATQKIRSEETLNRDTPILALTASAFASQVEKALNAGTTDFLAKPFTPKQLLFKIQEILAPELLHKPVEPKPKPSVNEALLRELYGDDTGVIRDMLGLFVESNLPLFRDIENLLAAADFSAARELVHKVKPSFAMIGLPALTESMSELETLCEQSDPKAQSFYLEIKNDLDQQLPAIGEYFGVPIP